MSIPFDMVPLEGSKPSWMLKVICAVVDTTVWGKYMNAFPKLVDTSDIVGVEGWKAFETNDVAVEFAMLFSGTKYLSLYTNNSGRYRAMAASYIKREIYVSNNKNAAYKMSLKMNVPLFLDPIDHICYDMDGNITTFLSGGSVGMVGIDNAVNFALIPNCVRIAFSDSLTQAERRECGEWILQRI